MGKKKIKIENRIIEHLGKNLITSPEVAFVELIKNSLEAEIDVQTEKKIYINYYSDISKIEKNCLLNKYNYEDKVNIHIYYTMISREIVLL